MDNDRALLFGMINLDKPGTNYDLYKYEFERGRIRRLTSDTGDEKFPDWTEGTLSVSPKEKKVTWATLKK